MLLSGMTAVVTGSNRGIGKSIIQTFAANGCDIFACARTQSEEFEKDIANISQEYNITIQPHYFDLLNKDEVKNETKEILNLGKQIDIVVNNAGVAHGSLFQMLKTDALKEVFDINTFAQLSFTQGFIRHMTKNKSGSIINIGSTAGIIGDIGTVAYGSSKAALMYSTKAIANELGRYNIRVNSVAPGITKTDMYNEMEDKALDKALSSISLGRAADPEEISNVVLFLASGLSLYVTGQTIKVDGGSF